MTHQLPDVVSDHCTDACKRVGWTLPQLFERAAQTVNGGFTNSAEVAQRWYRVWAQKGFQGLPPAAREFILEVCNGQHRHVALPTPAPFFGHPMFATR